MMKDEEIIRYLDRLEADMRLMEHRIYRVRVELRKRVDPQKKRKDLGYWGDEVGDVQSPNQG